MDQQNYETLTASFYSSPPVSYPSVAASEPSSLYVVPAPAPTPYPPFGFQQYPPPTSRHQSTSGRRASRASLPTVCSPRPGYESPQYTAAPPSQQPQQQQQMPAMDIVSPQQQQPVTTQHVQSFVGHMVFACVVLWCCNCLFGLIALLLASQFTFICVVVRVT